MPMAQEVNQQQSAGNLSNRTSNSNQQNSQSNTGKNASTQRSNNSGRKILKDQINSQVVVIMSLLVLHRKKIHLIWQR